MAENLIDQLVGVMPELAEISAWPSVGQRRGPDELGRITDQPVSGVAFGIAETGE